MILYHYSVDCFREGASLSGDYKNQFRFVQPFLLALERSRDCFWSVYFSSMSLSRELCDLGLRKHENYVKDAVEGVFEHVRRTEFSGRSVSRVGCVYYCEDAASAVALLKEDCLADGDYTPEQVKLLEVEVEEERVFRYDQSLFNDAMEAMENRRDLDRAFALARDYFSLRRSAAPVIELLSDGANRILRQIPVE